MIKAIVAVAQNLAIGRDGKLPWHHPADLKFFKETTTGHAVLMGSTTFSAIGRALPNRLNVVLSRKDRIAEPGIMQLASVDEAVELSKYLNRDLYVIGGATTYAEFAPFIEEWIVTEVPETIADADTYVPGDFLDRFVVQSVRQLDENLTVRILRRRS
jgi:dihydrofolate reductase